MLKPLVPENSDFIEKEVNGAKILEVSKKDLQSLISGSGKIQNLLSRTPVEDRLRTISELGKIWLEKLEQGSLKPLISRTSALTGYSEKMVEFEFSLIPSVFDYKALKKNIEASFGIELKALESFFQIEDGEYIRYLPKGPVFIIGSGNSSIPALIPTVISLLTGNFTILKPSVVNYEVIFSVFSSLKELETEFASKMLQAFVLSYFTHNSESLNYLLTEAKLGVVNFWGAGEARDQICQLVAKNPNRPEILINGPLTGVAVIDEDNFNEKTAEALAKNVVLYDQQLCSSPTVAFLVGKYENAKDFLRLLAKNLNRIGMELPMKAGDSYIYLLQKVKRALIFKGAFLESSKTPENPWTVVLSKKTSLFEDHFDLYPEFSIFVRKRFIEMVLLDDYFEIVEWVRKIPKLRSYSGIDGVQTVGIAIKPEVKNSLLEELASSVYRIVPIEDMFMRSPLEPYDGILFPRAFTKPVYYREKTMV
ncbi:MAG: aldehyde dehydrogenase family protein [Archaeoglobaceae archaeon]